MNTNDIEKMFNLNFTAGVDENSKGYIDKITKLREMQKKILPLYLESVTLVKKHQKCLKTIMDQNEEFIPLQLLKVIDKGQEGLLAYGKLLENIQKVLKRNNVLTDELQKYQTNIKQVQEKSKSIDVGVAQLGGDGQKRVEQSKDRLQNLLAGMFEDGK